MFSRGEAVWQVQGILSGCSAADAAPIRLSISRSRHSWTRPQETQTPPLGAGGTDQQPAHYLFPLAACHNPCMSPKFIHSEATWSFCLPQYVSWLPLAKLYQPSIKIQNNLGHPILNTGKVCLERNMIICSFPQQLHAGCLLACSFKQQTNLTEAPPSIHPSEEWKQWMDWSHQVHNALKANCKLYQRKVQRNTSVKGSYNNMSTGRVYHNLFSLYFHTKEKENCWNDKGDVEERWLWH